MRMLGMLKKNLKSYRNFFLWSYSNYDFNGLGEVSLTFVLFELTKVNVRCYFWKVLNRARHCM